VLRDIENPSAALNPDHIAYTVTLSDGRTLVGVPRTLVDGRIALGDAAGNETLVSREAVRSMQPLPVSIMPPALHAVLGPEKFRDLMTFLLLAPLEPAALEGPEPPAPRSRREVEEVLKTAEKVADPKPLRVLLVDGPKDHGPGEHDYPLWKQRWSKLLGLADGVTVDTAEVWPTDEQLRKADVAVFYQFGNWDAQRAAAIDTHLERGGGLVYLHWAVAGRENAAQFAKRIGLAAGLIKFRHGPLELTFTEHPITRGFKNVHFHDESYWKMTGDLGSIHVLATGIEEAQPQPLIWTRQVGQGRVFVSILGHFNWTFDDPLFRILVLRGIAWGAKQPVDRLIDLATVGARISD